MINNKVMNKLFSVMRFCTIIHLGKNPKRGGSPPKDKIRIMKLNLLYKNVWLNWQIFFLLKKQTTNEVNII